MSSKKRASSAAVNVVDGRAFVKFRRPYYLTLYRLTLTIATMP